MGTMTKAVIGGACCARRAGLAPAADAQAKYPVRPVRILIPFPAGGAADTIGRTLGEQLSAALGQPVVVDNRPGAAGRPATEMLAHAEPDGHTLLIGGVGPLAISPSLYRKLPYDPARDFLPITRVAGINKALTHPEVKKRQNAVGIEPVGSPLREVFVKFIGEDTVRWAKIIKDARVKVE